MNLIVIHISYINYEILITFILPTSCSTIMRLISQKVSKYLKDYS